MLNIKNKRILVYLSIILSLLILLTITFLLLNNNQKHSLTNNSNSINEEHSSSQLSSSTENIISDENLEENVSKDLILEKNTEAWEYFDNKSVSMGETKVPGYGILTIKSEMKQARITLPNPIENNCYFLYELTVGQETLYKSNLIPPGEAIKEFNLNYLLEKGEYKLTIKITPYSIDSKEELISTKINTDLIVV